MDRICTTMNWPVSETGLIISIDGRDFAYIAPARNGNYEGCYLIAEAYGVPNACYSAMLGNTELQIKRGLAKKLFANARNLKSGEIHGLVDRLTELTVRPRP